MQTFCRGPDPISFLFRRTLPLTCFIFGDLAPQRSGSATEHPTPEWPFFGGFYPGMALLKEIFVLEWLYSKGSLSSSGSNPRDLYSRMALLPGILSPSFSVLGGLYLRSALLQGNFMALFWGTLPQNGFAQKILFSSGSI